MLTRFSPKGSIEKWSDLWHEVGQSERWRALSCCCDAGARVVNCKRAGNLYYYFWPCPSTCENWLRGLNLRFRYMYIVENEVGVTTPPPPPLRANKYLALIMFIKQTLCWKRFCGPDWNVDYTWLSAGCKKFPHFSFNKYSEQKLSKPKRGNGCRGRELSWTRNVEGATV